MKPERAFVAVDLVLVGVTNGQPHVALINRPPESGIEGWGLPGAFIGTGEDLPDTTQRILDTKLGFVPSIRLRPLTVAAEPGRDPRGRVISLPHLALTSELPPLAEDAMWARARRRGSGWQVLTGDRANPLAVDHGAIAAEALQLLASMLDHTDPTAEPAKDLLPTQFAVRELLEVYEAFRDPTKHPSPYDVNSFRRRIKKHPDIRESGDLEELPVGQAHRPGRLLTFR